MNALMRAVLFDTTGEAEEVLSLREVAIPTLNSREVLVQVDARPIQPSDLMFIGGRYRIKPKPPQIAGLEGGGTVVATGPHCTVQTGTRVAFRHPGTWAEYVAVPEAKLYVVPDGVDIEAAAQFSLNPITAWALLDELQVAEGSWIALNAATSHVAGLLRALCDMRGIHTVNLVRNGPVADRGHPTLVVDGAVDPQAVLRLTNGALLAGLLDSVGGSAITSLLPAMAVGSTIVSYGTMSQEAAMVSNADVIYRNITWKGFGIDHWLGVTPRRAEMLAALWPAISSGRLPLPVAERHDLSDFRNALSAAARRARQGEKILITSERKG